METAIIQYLLNFVSSSLLTKFTTVFLAQYFPFLVVALFLFLVVFRIKEWHKKTLTFLFSVFSILLSTGIALRAIQFFFPRTRPFETISLSPLIEISGASFPSAHATIFFTLAFAILLINKRWGVWFTVFAFLIGTTRVAAGIHWPSDFLGGALLAGVTVTLAYFLLKDSWQEILKLQS